MQHMLYLNSSVAMVTNGGVAPMDERKSCGAAERVNNCTEIVERISPKTRDRLAFLYSAAMLAGFVLRGGEIKLAAW